MYLDESVCRIKHYLYYDFMIFGITLLILFLIRVSGTV